MYPRAESNVIKHTRVDIIIKYYTCQVRTFMDTFDLKLEFRILIYPYDGCICICRTQLLMSRKFLHVHSENNRNTDRIVTIHAAFTMLAFFPVSR